MRKGERERKICPVLKEPVPALHGQQAQCSLSMCAQTFPSDHLSFAGLIVRLADCRAVKTRATEENTREWGAGISQE